MEKIEQARKYLSTLNVPDSSIENFDRLVEEFDLDVVEDE